MTEFAKYIEIKLPIVICIKNATHKYEAYLLVEEKNANKQNATEWNLNKGVAGILATVGGILATVGLGLKLESHIVTVFLVISFRVNFEAFCP